MSNKNREILEDLISNYIEDLYIYNAVFKNPILDKKLILPNMEETAYKLRLACADLRKEIK